MSDPRRILARVPINPEDVRALQQTERVQRCLIDHLRADRDRIEAESSATIRSLQSSLDQAWRQRDVAYARRDKLRADHEAATRGWSNALDELEALRRVRALTTDEAT